MRLSAIAALALGVILAAPIAANADAATPSHHHIYHRPYKAAGTVQPSSAAQVPAEPASSSFAHGALSARPRRYGWAQSKSR